MQRLLVRLGSPPHMWTQCVPATSKSLTANRIICSYAAAASGRRRSGAEPSLPRSLPQRSLRPLTHHVHRYRQRHRDHPSPAARPHGGLALPSPRSLPETSELILLPCLSVSVLPPSLPNASPHLPPIVLPHCLPQPLPPLPALPPMPSPALNHHLLPVLDNRDERLHGGGED